MQSKFDYMHFNINDDTASLLGVNVRVLLRVLQVWAWKENVWEKEKGTLLERYTVEQSKPSAEGGGVLSTLTINNVMESDFLSTYNCTAWNSFGPGTMIISLEETGAFLLCHSDSYGFLNCTSGETWQRAHVYS